MKNAAILAVACVLTLAGGRLRGEAAAWNKDYALGMRDQRAGRWAESIRLLRGALADAPGATWLYVPLGNTYYLAGDRRGALACYRLYLAGHPGDRKVRAFADALAAAEADAAPASAGAPAESKASAILAGLSLELDSGLVLNDGSDVAALMSGPGYDVPADGAYAAWFGAGADYALPDGFTAGLDGYAGPSRAYPVSFPGGPDANVAVTNFGFQIAPGWDFHFLGRLLLEPRLGIGYMASSVDDSQVSGSWHASGATFWPQIRAEWLWDRWGLGASLGYLVADFSTVKDAAGDAVQVAEGSGYGDWGLTNGGVSLGLYVRYHFRAPFPRRGKAGGAPQ